MSWVSDLPDLPDLRGFEDVRSTFRGFGDRTSGTFRVKNLTPRGLVCVWAPRITDRREGSGTGSEKRVPGSPSTR